MKKWILKVKGRLLRFMRYTKEKAHNLIKHSVYIYAQDILRKRYGDSHILLLTYRKEITSWTKLKFGNAKDFRHLYNFLEKYEGVARGNCWNAINTLDSLYDGIKVTQWSDLQME